MAIPTRAKQKRLELGLSLTETAARANISADYLGRIENNCTVRPSLKVQYRLGNVLGVRYSELQDRPAELHNAREAAA